MRKPVIAGNWKMYKRLGEAVGTALTLRGLVSNANHCEVVIAPVFVHLKTISDRLEGSNVKVAAQDCAAESKDSANTGEVSAAMLKDVGCSHIIIGHSERRQFYGETDELVNKKTKAAIASNLIAIVCVGETLEERESEKLFDVIGNQLRNGLDGLTSSDVKRIIIAYEPVWAIGTGKTASPEQAQEMHGFIRSVLADSHGADTANATRILYGGSVKPENIADLMKNEDIDGALVGGASLDAESFARIVNFR
ncbi:MAG TPA: triose-phosphate isomerase [Pyrinomonadaceae bacterium]|nr:triose-phosphate isomerase [Pyrinomonadaceae bacterium]